MKILKLISYLLDYPADDLPLHKGSMIDTVTTAEHLSENAKTLLIDFIEARCGSDILDWQSDYDGLFERGRSLSLLLFEHVHGESRDRGQAMIDLQNQYKAAGLEIGVRELPDYIPLYLEFASTQGSDNAKHWLQDVAHIIALLAARLKKREGNYANLMLALLDIAEIDIDLAEVETQIENEKRDETKEALDKGWEEEAISFGGDAVNGGCPSNANRPSESQRRDQDLPINFVDAAPNARPSQPLH